MNPRLAINVVALSALALSGCTTSYRAQSTSIAERICSIDSLRTQRDLYVDEARGLADLSLGIIDLDDGGLLSTDAFGESSSREGRVSVTEAPYGDGTQITRLLRTFELDLDASYRFATTSCQAYAMCMQMNASIEQRCDNTRRDWDDAQARFAETSLTLGEIRESIARAHVERQGGIIVIDRPPTYRHHHHSHSHRNRHH